MEDIKDKIKAAKKEGFTDVQIVDFLAQLPDVGPQVTTALESQYKPAEILKFLGQSPAYREGTQRSTTQRGIVTALQGPTFGFLDELAGAVTAPFTAMQQNIPLGQAYQQGRDIVRGQTESFEAERPFTAAGAQLAASLPVSLVGLPAQAGRMMLPTLQRTAPSIAPTVQAAGRYLTGAPATGQVLGLGQRTAQAGAAGAGYGFVGGLGSSTADNPLDVLSDAATSAVFGSALGATTQPAQSILGAVGRQATARMSPSAASTQAQQQVAQALIRDVPEPLDPGTALSRAQARLLKLGPEARIADVGGQSTFNLLDVQATLPGTTPNAVARAIRERQVGAGPRLMTASDQTLGTQGAQFTQSIDNFNLQRFNESRPYYAVVDSSSIPVDNNLIGLLKKSGNLKRDAEDLYRKQTGMDIDLSALKYGEQVPMNVLDTLKQTLFDKARAARQAGNTNDALATDKIRVDLIDLLTNKSPKIGGQSAYGLAMKTYAGPSQMMEAADIGRQVMRGDILDVQQATKGMSQSEIDAYRIGVLQALRQQTGTEGGRTSLLKFYKEPATQDRLKAAFGNDYKAFSAAVLREGQLKKFEAAGRGSQTAARLAGEADLDVAPLGQAVSAAASGNPLAIVTAATNLARQAKTPEAVRNEIGRILLSRDPRQLDQLSEIIRQLNASRSRAAGVSGFGAGQIGSMISDNPMP
ncbi:hypothetical protein [Limnohabitans sp.]|uniref:hypothetical protein n=1 Tax=Limnohabitans sp. TaxID=1907725 RepID=UPI0033412A16